MDVEGIQKIVHAEFGAAVGPAETAGLAPGFEVDPDAIRAVAHKLKTHTDLAFDGLLNLTGTDHPDRDKIQVVYELTSFSLGHDVVVRVDVPRAAARTQSVSDVWRAANWLEREVYDLLGVDFDGHPDQRRILLPDDWVGHPLRKDYVEAPEYHGISTMRESILNIPNRH